MAFAYLHAGARCVITATYQVTPQGLMTHRGLSSADAQDAILRAVLEAQAARELFLREREEDSVAPAVFIAGSVGPYGAYLADGSEYRGDYQLSCEAFQDFHRPRIRALLAANVDILAIETQPSAKEVGAIVDLLAKEFSDAVAWVSCTASSHSPCAAMSDGTPWSEVVTMLDGAPNVVAIGVNCLPLHASTDVLREVGKYTSKPLVVYPNSGETYDAGQKRWGETTADQVETLADLCEQWVHLGARLVGGCCRTGPRDIAHVAQRLCTAGFDLQ